MDLHDSSNHSIRDLVIRLLARELKMKAEDINLTAPLIEMGLDSMSALIIAGELEDRWGIRLSTTLLWDCPTAEALILQLRNTLQHNDSVQQKHGS